MQFISFVGKPVNEMGRVTEHVNEMGGVTELWTWHWNERTCWICQHVNEMNWIKPDTPDHVLLSDVWTKPLKAWTTMTCNRSAFTDTRVAKSIALFNCSFGQGDCKCYVRYRSWCVGYCYDRFYVCQLSLWLVVQICAVCMYVSFSLADSQVQAWAQQGAVREGVWFVSGKDGVEV